MRRRERAADPGTGRVATLRQVAQRAQSGPMLVRGLLFAAAAAALGLAMPSELLLSRYAIAALALAAAVALAPRGRMATAVLLIAAGSWVVATVLFDDRVVYWRLAALAGAMYLVHSLAALAAVLPHDAQMSHGLLGRWLLRAGAVIVLSSALGMLTLAESEVFGGRSYLLASIVGVAIVGALVWVIGQATRR